MSAFYTATDHFVLLPALLLALFGCAVLLFDFWVFPEERYRKWLLLFLALAEGFTGYAMWRQQSLIGEVGGQISAFQGSLVADGFGLFFQWIFVVATLIVGLISYRYLEVRGEHHGEYYGLLLLAQCGMHLLAGGTDLVTIFVGLETMAITFYILVGFLRGDKRSNEAAMKYLLLGAFSSGFLVYGFSILYGISGSTKLIDVTTAVATRGADPLVVMALVTVSVGLFFKISAVPFHMWAPDAYEGAPTTITAFLSVGSKAASFALLLRIFLGPLGSLRGSWEPVLAAVAVLSLIAGNFAAVTQTNTKRLLAYSSISHAGYMLLGLVAGNVTGIQGVLIYMLVYAFMNLGAFLVLTALAREGLAGEDINDLAGLMQRSPVFAILMLVFMLSLAGIPPTAGFFGKYFIFLALVETGHYTLAVIAALFVAVAIYYYFRIVRAMFTTPQEDQQPLAASFGVRLALGLTGLATLGIGLYPEPIVRLAQQSFMR